MAKNRDKKKRRWRLTVIIVAAVFVAALGIYKIKSSRTDADLILTISEQGFEGHFYDSGEREKAVITFSGSEGGSKASDTMAWYYQQHGISALGVILFAGKETGENLDRVPLEYVENAIAWLKEQGFEKIAVDGISKGSEYALLAASRFDDISCVIARVPSYFVSEGMIGRSGPSGTSCWSYHGEELNYTPYIIRDFDILKQLRTYGELNILSYNTGKDVTDESIIPVENIRGPILLISTEADTVWPSTEQAAHIVSDLQEHDFPYEVKSLTYEKISHFAIPMRSNTWLLKLMFQSERQFPEECAAERTDLSEQAVDFIQNHW